MTLRCFISVDVGDRLEWHALRTELGDVDRGVRPVRPEQLHLTLRFLGDTDESLVDELEGVMARAVEGQSPFTMDFVGVGVFPKPSNPRVVWVGLQGAEPLEGISGRLEEGVVGLGFEPERRRFRPHATVARVKSLRRRERMASLLERWRGAELGSMEVREVRLMRSQLRPEGAIHTTLRTVELKG